MKFRVVGWTYYDTYEFEEGEISWAAQNAVIDDIKKHGYLFSGYDHQENYYCVPVLNDGKMRRFSQRGFGGVMAEAHGYTGIMDYSLFAFYIDPDEKKVPKDRGIEDFDAEENLNETFTLTVTKKILSAAKNKGEIKLDDLPELRYLDKGDTLILRCGANSAEFIVEDVDRKKDLTEKKLEKFQMDFYCIDDDAKLRRAEAAFNKIKVVILIKLKEK